MTLLKFETCRCVRRIFCTSAFVFLVLTTTAFSQKTIDSSIIEKLNLMCRKDQECRMIIHGPEKWKNFIKMPKVYQDSIWKEVEETDSLNFIDFVWLLKTYGYITSVKRSNMTLMSGLLLHYISAHEVNQLDTLLMKEVIEGRMPPKDYAQWYDRYLLQSCNKRELYGEYERVEKFPCVDDINLTNEARKKLGLPPFKKSKCIE